MMLFLRIFRHLLPDGAAWRLNASKSLTRLLDGLAKSPADARQFIDDVHNDLFPDTTRELVEWEKQFGLWPRGSESEATRRQDIAAAWKAQGGQSPRYLQDVMQTAGFNVFIHEWWDPSSLPTVVVRDPHDYTNEALVGTVQCRPTTGAPAGTPARCRASSASNPNVYAYRCNRWLVNDVRYIVNLNRTREAPPRLPTDPDAWPFFLYWSSADIDVPAEVSVARRGEFERLLKKLCPAHLWLVTNVTYV